MNSTLRILLQIILSSLILVGSYWLGNHALRVDFWPSFGVYLSLGVAMMLVYWSSYQDINWKFIFLLGVLMRLSLLVAIPNFSDDFARFLWDGHLIQAGQNPYLNTPREVMNAGYFSDTHDSKSLFEQLNSSLYYSVYPPSNQAIFWFASWVGSGSVLAGIVTLRVVLLVGEIAVFFLFLLLFRQFQVEIRKLWFYWINPFVVLEIIGNLHFEGLVLLFLLLMIYFLTQRKFVFSGFAWGLAIGLKLLPLLLFPAWFIYPETRKNGLFWIGLSLALLLSFWFLFLDSSWFYFGQSLRLYQGKFEFNASIYYLVREIGFWVQGYNMIAGLTKVLSVLTLLLAFYVSWRRRISTVLELIDLFVILYLVYLIFQPVVHPWYLIPGLGLSLLTSRMVFLSWSFLIFLAYQAYSNSLFEENSLILWAEYGVLFLIILTDYFLPKRKTNLLQ